MRSVSPRQSVAGRAEPVDEGDLARPAPCCCGREPHRTAATDLGEEAEQQVVEHVGLVDADRVAGVLDDHRAARHECPRRRLGVLADHTWLSRPASISSGRKTAYDVAPVLQRVVAQEASVSGAVLSRNAGKPPRRSASRATAGPDRSTVRPPSSWGRRGRRRWRRWRCRSRRSRAATGVVEHLGGLVDDHDAGRRAGRTGRRRPRWCCRPSRRRPDRVARSRWSSSSPRSRPWRAIRWPWAASPTRRGRAGRSDDPVAGGQQRVDGQDPGVAGAVKPCTSTTG